MSSDSPDLRTGDVVLVNGHHAIYICPTGLFGECVVEMHFRDMPRHRRVVGSHELHGKPITARAEVVERGEEIRGFVAGRTLPAVTTEPR